MIEIPTNSDNAAYYETVNINGTSYRLFFNWNSKDSAWYLSFLTTNNISIVSGIKLVVNYELINDYKDSGLPKGFLIAFDVLNTGEPVGRNDLGKRIKLLYFSENEEGQNAVI